MSVKTNSKVESWSFAFFVRQVENSASQVEFNKIESTGSSAKNFLTQNILPVLLNYFYFYISNLLISDELENRNKDDDASEKVRFKSGRLSCLMMGSFRFWSFDGSTRNFRDENFNGRFCLFISTLSPEFDLFCVVLRHKMHAEVCLETRSWLHNKQLLKADPDDRPLTLNITCFHFEEICPDPLHNRNVLRHLRNRMGCFRRFQSTICDDDRTWSDFILNWSHEPSFCCHMDFTLIANPVNGHTKSHQFNCFLIPSRWSSSHLHPSLNLLARW